MGTMELSQRPDLKLIFETIDKNSKVLDLGCGKGELLHALRENKGAEVRGLEIDQNDIVECIGKGIPVVQVDLNKGLTEYPDDAFDYVILSHTLQVVRNPDQLLKQMVRVGKKCIVSFINIGYFIDRCQLFFKGHMPKSEHLPYEWYNTPNIHLGTMKDFRALCKELDINVVREWPVNHFIPFLPGLMPNLLAKDCVFLLEK